MPKVTTPKVPLIILQTGRVASYALEKGRTKNENEARKLYVKKSDLIQRTLQESGDRRWRKLLRELKDFTLQASKKPVPLKQWTNLFRSVVAECKQHGFNPEGNTAELREIAENLLRQRGTSRISFWYGDIESSGTPPEDHYFRYLGTTPLLQANEERALGWMMKQYVRAASQHLKGPDRKEFAEIQIRREKNLRLLLNTTNANNITELQDALDEGLDREKEMLHKSHSTSGDGRRRRLELLCKQSEAARWLFIEANLRLVVDIAPKFEDRGLELMSLIGAGNMGLIRAVDLFDYRFSFKFSTYASNWIKTAIQNDLKLEVDQIHIPFHMLEKIRQYERKEQMALGSAQPFDNMAAAMSVEKSKKAKSAGTIVEVSARSYISLDQEIDDPFDNTMDLQPIYNNSNDERERTDSYAGKIRELLSFIANPKERGVFELIMEGVSEEKIAALLELGRPQVNWIKRKTVETLAAKIPLEKSEELENALLRPRR